MIYLTRMIFAAGQNRRAPSCDPRVCAARDDARDIFCALANNCVQTLLQIDLTMLGIDIYRPLRRPFG